MGSEAALEEELDLEPRVGDALEKEIEVILLFVCLFSGPATEDKHFLWLFIFS